LIRLQTIDLPRMPGHHALFTLEPNCRRQHGFKSWLRLTPGELGTVLGLVEQLDLELSQRKPGFGFMATAFFMQLVGWLSRHYGSSRHADTHNLLRLAKTIAYLETNFHETLDLESLAKMAGMSKRSFLRTFQAGVGLTPIAYLIQLRVNRAAAMLRSGTENITEVAFRCGFADSNYFTRQFKQIMGQSPRRYRQLAFSGTALVSNDG
jgi:AraC-like DNA-binding protein